VSIPTAATLKSYQEIAIEIADYISTIEKDTSLGQLGYPEQCHRDGRLACSKDIEYYVLPTKSVYVHDGYYRNQFCRQCQLSRQPSPQTIKTAKCPRLSSHSNTNQSVSITGRSMRNRTSINITFWLILKRNFLE
jgi:hypothetical protein